MTRQEIEKYLRVLGEELQKRQITGEIILAGGAVMLLVIQNRETTREIDALEARMTDQPTTIMPDQVQSYHYQTAAETLDRILHGTAPWVAIGGFLDDRRSAPLEKRPMLVADPIAEVGNNNEFQRWAAPCAAMVEWLCWNNHLPFPAWTTCQDYILSQPWFLYPGWRLRAWQLATTPAPFKMRNIFGGDRILDRV